METWKECVWVGDRFLKTFNQSSFSSAPSLIYIFKPVLDCWVLILLGIPPHRWPVSLALCGVLLMGCSGFLLPPAFHTPPLSLCLPEVYWNLLSSNALPLILLLLLWVYILFMLFLSFYWNLGREGEGQKESVMSSSWTGSPATLRIILLL